MRSGRSPNFAVSAGAVNLTQRLMRRTGGSGTTPLSRPNQSLSMTQDFICDSETRQDRRVEPLDLAFQKFSKPDRHRPRIRVNHVPTFQVANQNAIKIIQVVIKDDGNPCPFSILAKNLSTSHDRNILPVF
jgi:hypothetical protein